TSISPCSRMRRTREKDSHRYSGKSRSGQPTSAESTFPLKWSRSGNVSTGRGALYDPHKRLDEVAALERCSWGSWLTEAQRHRRYSRLGADRRGISETDADRHGAAPNDAERLRGLTAAREAPRCLFVAHPQPFVVKAPPPDVEKTARRLGASAKELREITKLVDLVI